MGEHATSIFRVEMCRMTDQNRLYGKAAWKAITQTHGRGEKIELGSAHRLSCLANSSAMKTDAVRSSEMSVNFYQTIWRHIQKTVF
jgi:hypothetical protein